jgi:rare lipoprotein A
MAPPALLPLNAIRNPLSAKHGKALIKTLLVVISVFVSAIEWDGADAGYETMPNSTRPTDAASASVVLSFGNTGASAAGDSELVLLVDAFSEAEMCLLDAALTMSRVDLEGVANDEIDASGPTRSEQKRTQSIRAILANTGDPDLAAFVQQKMLPKFAAAYRSILRFATIIGLPRILEEAALSRATIIGVISTYNPYREGKEEGGMRTASGELYDPSAWTAAVQSRLRNQFGGVRFGKLYQPAYALVASGERRVIVKINDVGPLKSGRVLDLNERSMRYFDPFLTQGLIQDAKITLLPGEDWIPGPIGEAYAIDFAAIRQRPVDSANEEIELKTIRAKFDRTQDTDMKSDGRAEAKLSAAGSDR